MLDGVKDFLEINKPFTFALLLFWLKCFLWSSAGMKLLDCIYILFKPSLFFSSTEFNDSVYVESIFFDQLFFNWLWLVLLDSCGQIKSTGHVLMHFLSPNPCVIPTTLMILHVPQSSCMNLDIGQSLKCFLFGWVSHELSYFVNNIYV